MSDACTGLQLRRRDVLISGLRAVVVRGVVVSCALAAAVIPVAVASPLHATLSDRPLKVCLAARLARPPQLIVLGSSRAEKVEPSLVQSLTGLRTFNASVSGGTPDDAWAYANFLHSLPGVHSLRVLWFLDVESLGQTRANPGLLATPELAPYLEQPPGVPASPSRQCVLRTTPGTRYSDTGFRVHDFHDTAVEQGTSQRRSLAIGLVHYRALYANYRLLARPAERRFEETVALINRWGATPVIVLTPVLPAFARALDPSWTRMHRKVVAYLASLPPTLRIDVVDASSITTFGGSESGFYDGVHMKVANTRLLVRHVVRSARRFLLP